MDREFEIRIRAEQLRQYRDVLKEIPKIEKEINKILKQKEGVPIVKDKVKASLDDFPYTETHVTVDAPEPVLNTHLEKLLIKKRVRMEFLTKERLAVEDFINGIGDSRTRQIFDAVFVNGVKQKDVAIEFDLTEGRVSQIIQEEIEKSV